MRSQQHLELSQKQLLALNQLQYHSLRLLQCSAAELAVEIDKAIADNPLLEKTETVDLGNLNKLDRYWLDYANNQHLDDIPDLSETTSLTSYLLEQLRLLKLKPAVNKLVLALISELNEKAYLDQNITWADLNKNLGLDASPKQWDYALSILQSFDPIGVGARSLAESLKLQLLKQDFDIAENIYIVAINMTEYLADAVAGRWQKLERVLATDRVILEHAYKLIQQLNPYPIAAWDNQEINYIVPDVLIYKAENKWCVSLNPSLGSNLRINHELLTNIKRSQVSPEFNEKINQAKNMLHNLQQRGQTIALVSEFLANYQSDFLYQGKSALLPLKLADVAQALGLHISTISRATRLKYAQTPLGLLALKDFFAYQLNMGDAVYSPQAIQDKIAVLITNEDKAKPLSDMALCKLLQDQGINIARRTLSKYREQLGFASSYTRKI